MAPPRWLARIAGTLTVAVGLVHAAVGIAEYAWPSFEALWFHGSGMALLLIGALTVLAASERAWPALAAVALASNLLGVALAVAFGTLSDWRQPQGPVLGALFVVGALGCMPALRTPARTPAGASVRE
jgi:hypothetical protein